MIIRVKFLLSIVLSFAFAVSFAFADDSDVPEPMIRIEYERETVPVSLQTPILRFEGSYKGEPIQIDLIGAIHFADSEYYAVLNRRFTQYDAVGVEMILPKGVPLSAVSQNNSFRTNKIKDPLDAFAAFQLWMGKTLQLTSQLDEIDYGSSNMVIADMDAETLKNSIAESDEINDLLLDIFLAIFSQDDAKVQNGASYADAWAILFSRNRPRQLKRLFARLAAEEMDTKIPFEKSLIEKRNAAAFGRLMEQIDAGKRNLALFYGAAHLPGLAQKLENDLHLRPVGTEWLDAWSLK